MDYRRKQRLAAPHREKLMVAARSGDVEAGMALLQHAMVALEDIAAGKEAGEAHLVTLRYLNGCIRDFLVEGIALERALNIENTGGRPKNPIEIEVLSHLHVSQELDRMAANGEPSLVLDAQKRVAHRKGWKLRAVQRAWQAAGGLKRYKCERSRE